MAEILTEAPDVTVSRRFTVRFDDGSEYVDAIVLPKADMDALTAAERRVLMRDRARAWRQSIADARLSPRPSRAERLASLQARRADLAAEVARMDSAIAETEAEQKRAG